MAIPRSQKGPAAKGVAQKILFKHSKIKVPVLKCSHFKTIYTKLAGQGTFLFRQAIIQIRGPGTSSKIYRTGNSPEPLLWDLFFACFVVRRYASDSQLSNQTTPTLKSIWERPQAIVTVSTSGHEIPKRLVLTEWTDGVGIEHAETAPSDLFRWRSVKTTVKTSVETLWKLRDTSWKLSENFAKLALPENTVNLQQNSSVQYNDLFI